MVICSRCETLLAEAGRCTSCGRRPGLSRKAARAAPPLAARERVGDFRISSLVSDHEFRRVYAASGPAGPCILKELCTEGASAKRRRDLELQHEREASILRRLRHRAIPRLLASFEDRGRRWIAIARVPGSPLWRANGAPLTEAAALSIAGAVASVLAAIHSASPPVYHLDLSPGNVLLAASRRGRRARARVSLIDFGGARSAGEPAIGLYTDGFQSPERHLGPEEGAAADIYAVGTLLHFLLTGHDPSLSPPFQHPPVRELAPWVSARTEALCLWLLQPDPSERPRDAATVAAAARGRGAVPLRRVAALGSAIRDFAPTSQRLLERQTGRRRRPRPAAALAGHLLAKGQAQGARRVLLDALETLRREPGRWSVEDRAAPLATLAEHYLLSGDGERALAVSEEARGLAGPDPRTEVVAARALAALGRSDEALRVADSAAEAGGLAPAERRAVLLSERAERLLAVGRPVEAEEAAREALGLDASSFEAARALDRAATHERRVAELRARVASSASRDAPVDLGLALVAGGERAAGEALLEGCVKALAAGRRPGAGAERRLLRWRLRNLAEERGLLQAALVAADDARALHPRAPFFVFYGGLVAFLLERFEDAAARFRRLLALGAGAEPDGSGDEHTAGARAHFWMGRSLERLGRRDDALASYKRAVASAPGYGEALRHVRRLEAAPEPQLTAVRT